MEEAELFWVTSTELRDGDWRDEPSAIWELAVLFTASWTRSSGTLASLFSLMLPSCCLGAFPSLSFSQPNVCQKNYQWELLLFAFCTWNEWLIASDIIYLRLGNPPKVPNNLLSIHFFHIMSVFQSPPHSKNMIACWLSNSIPIFALCKKFHCTTPFWSISYSFVSIQAKAPLSQWGALKELVTPPDWQVRLTERTSFQLFLLSHSVSWGGGAGSVLTFIIYTINI